MRIGSDDRETYWSPCSGGRPREESVERKEKRGHGQSSSWSRGGSKGVNTGRSEKST